MLDVLIRILAHVLTPLFLVGMAGAALLVMSKLVSDILEFFEDDGADHAAKSNAKQETSASV